MRRSPPVGNCVRNAFSEGPRRCPPPSNLATTLARTWTSTVTGSPSQAEDSDKVKKEQPGTGSYGGRG